MKKFCSKFFQHALPEDFFEADDIVGGEKSDLALLDDPVEAVVENVGVNPRVLRIVWLQILVPYLIGDVSLLYQINAINRLV